MTLRKSITVWGDNIVTDRTLFADLVYTGRKVRHLRAPWTLSVTTGDVNTTEPTETEFSIIMTMQDSVDGTTWDTVTSFLTVAITTTGAQTHRIESAIQMQEWVRCVITSASSTWGGGSTVSAVLTGDSGHS